MNDRKSWRRQGLPMACALAIPIVLAGALSGQAQEAPRWRFEPGQWIRYEFAQVSKFATRDGRPAEQRTVRLTAALAWEVKAVEAGTATIAQTIERVRAEVTVGDQAVVFDSSKNEVEGPNATALSELYGAVMAEPATLKIDPRGRILEAAVPEKVTQTLRGSPFQALADGGSLMSERGLKTMLGQVLPPLPEELASSGMPWKDRLEIGAGPLRMILDSEYHLGSVEDQRARITSVIDTTIEPRPGVPLKVMVKSQEGSGTFLFDLSAGRLASAEVKQAFNLDIEVGDQSFGQSLEIEQTLKPIGEGS